MQAQEIPSEPHGAALLQLNKLGKIFIRDFCITRQPKVRPEQADPIMECPKVVSSSVRRSPATAAAAKPVRRLASCETQQKFGSPPTREAEQFDSCGRRVGQGKHGASLSRHRSPPEPSPNTTAAKWSSVVHGAHGSQTKRVPPQGATQRSVPHVHGQRYNHPDLEHKCSQPWPSSTIEVWRGKGEQGLSCEEPHSQLHSTPNAPLLRPPRVKEAGATAHVARPAP
jgi:hypothetical protein